jgi:hypothetical protein
MGSNPKSTSLPTGSRFQQHWSNAAFDNQKQKIQSKTLPMAGFSIVLKAVLTAIFLLVKVFLLILLFKLQRYRQVALYFFCLT